MTELYKQIGKALFCKDCEAYRPFADWLSEGPCHRHPPQRDSGSHPPVYQAVRVRDFDFCFDLIPKEEEVQPAPPARTGGGTTWAE